MSIDLTPAEMKALVRLCEASDMSNPAIAQMHYKASQYLKNYGEDDVQPPEPGPDPRVSAAQWKSPI